MITKRNESSKYRYGGTSEGKRYKYRYGGSGLFQSVGRKITSESVKNLIKKASKKIAQNAIDKAAKGVGNLVGEVITKKTEEAIGKISKPKRKQEYTDIVNSLIQHTKPSGSASSIEGIISGSGIVYD